MRNLLIYLLFILSVSSSTALDKFEFTPINIDLKGLEARGDTIVAYGNYGSALISYDDTETWEQIRIFEKGNIINFFFEEDKMTAFSNKGDINISYDGGETWSNKAKLKDSIVYVIKYPNGYFYTTKSKIKKLSDNFKITGDFPIIFSQHWAYHKETAMRHRRTIAFIDNNLIAQIDTLAVFAKFDINLNPIDTLSFIDLGICDDCRGIYRLFTDSSTVYLGVSNNIYKTTDFKTVKKFFSYDKNYEMFGDSTYPHYFKIINNKKYSLNWFDHGPKYNIFEILDSKTAQKIGEIDCSIIIESDSPTPINIIRNDFIVENERLTILADNKFIATVKLPGNNTIRISDLTGFNSSLPDIINDSSFLYHADNIIYITKNGGVTFKHVEGDSILFRKYNENYGFGFRYFDDKTHKLYYGGYSKFKPDSALIFISDDYGKNFTIKNMDSLSYAGRTNLTNFQKSKNYFSIGKYSKGNKYYNHIYLYNRNFNLITHIKDSNYTIEYVHAIDKDKYYLIAGDPKRVEQKKYFKFTTNKGKNWQTLKEYDYSIVDTMWIDSVNYQVITVNNLVYYNEITFLNKKYLFLFSFRNADSVFNIEVVDLKAKKIDSVFQRKIPSGNFQSNLAVDNYKDTIYIAYGDTLFFTNDVFNIKKWNYLVFPNSGKVWKHRLKIFDNKILALYEDNLHPVNLYLIRSTDSITSVSESNIKQSIYFYFYPPYPIPAQNYVNSKIYWDPNYNIDNLNISIYDIMGSQIEGDENIEINKQSSWSGILTWNCSAISNGTYFIVIRFGTTTKSITVLVNN